MMNTSKALKIEGEIVRLCTTQYQGSHYDSFLQEENYLQFVTNSNRPKETCTPIDL